MAPQKAEQNSTPNFGMTRITCPLHYDSSSAPIPIQLDLVTPSVVLDPIPQTETIRESPLFRDVAAFIGRHFASLKIVKETNYFDKMVVNGVLGAQFVYYFASSYEKQVYFAMLHTWWWLLDDWIDICALKSPMGKMKIIDIIGKFIETGKENQEERIYDPLLRSVLKAYAECDAMADRIVPDYPKVKHRFTKELKLYLQSGAWALMDSNLVGSGYSFETFLHWRKVSGGADASNELLMLLENGNPPNYIVDHLMVKTLFNTSSTLFALRNDIVGVKRDLARNDTGGTVMYKILVEGKSAPVAVQEIVSLHEKLTRDYVQLRKAVLTMFKNYGEKDFNKLLNYIELLERYEYGATVFWFTTPRYQIDGKFELEHFK
ncbi:Microbial Terpene synthase-like protein 1 [Folsomia candida]|uniref:Terpene synthase n=1 Tax=Folsomia candida TaxID=158441 RepID=A0A226D6J8_FOLCA|nr:Microbial Terpene synthase-like protein 1 [Folsomia candida]